MMQICVSQGIFLPMYSSIASQSYRRVRSEYSFYCCLIAFYENETRWKSCEEVMFDDKLAIINQVEIPEQLAGN